MFLLRDRFTGHSRGVAFITFDSQLAVEAALRLDGTEYGGKKLRINLAVDKCPKDTKVADCSEGEAGDSKAKAGEGHCGEGKGKAKSKGRGKQCAPPPAVGDVPAGSLGVVVKSLSFDATEAHLAEMFQTCGSGPTRVRLLMDKQTGWSKGKAFLDFADQAGVRGALRLNGTELLGRRLLVEVSTSRP